MSYKLDIAKDHQIRVLVCTPTIAAPAAVDQFVDQIKTQSVFSYAKVEQYFELNDHIPADSTGTLVILTIQDKAEFVQTLQFLTAHESKIQQGFIKVTAFCKMDHPRIISILKSKGVTEILEFNISVKAFGYKIKGALQTIEQTIENAKKSANSDASIAQGKAARNQHAGSKTATQYKVQWTSPNEHFSDFWMLLNQKHARYVIGKWMVNFYGPGPNSGHWEQTKLQMNGEKGWIFNPRIPTDQTFYKDEGRWIFFGNCPEFSWEQRIWYFISKKPTLAFYVGETVIHQKIVFQENGDITLNANSETAKALKSLIATTIEASIRLHTDKEKKKSNVSFENELANSKELSAEVSEENATELDYTEEKEDSEELYGRFEKEKSKELEYTEESYESAELKINITSKNGEKVEITDPIALIELRETQAIIDIPTGLLLVGDEIEFEANLKEGKKNRKITFSASTKIVESEMTDGVPDASKRSAAICELNQAIKGHFTDVVDQLQAKRELLDGFFKKAKGA